MLELGNFYRCERVCFKSQGHSAICSLILAVSEPRPRRICVDFARVQYGTVMRRLPAAIDTRPDASSEVRLRKLSLGLQTLSIDDVLVRAPS